jgi:hypothetical protein
MFSQDLVGHRVRCDYMYDVFDSTGQRDEAATRMKGVCGRITLIDGLGQIHVKWENGSSLALNSETDRYTILD